MSRNSTFDAWMIEVDGYCQRATGLSVHDLEDCCFADWYEDGVSPLRAARMAIRRSMGEDD